MNNNENKNGWIEKIENLKNEFNVPEIEMKYFEKKYKDLEEKEYRFFIELVILSYSYVTGISLVEREAYVKGMIDYINYCEKLDKESKLEEFEKETNQMKKVMTIKANKIRMNRVSHIDMYEDGIEGIIADNKVKTRVLRKNNER